MYKNGGGGCNICDSKSLGAMRVTDGGVVGTSRIFKKITL